MRWWKITSVIDYTHAVKFLTANVFFVLGVAILNYGTKLEAAISKSEEQ